jgi:aryl-alcohol dehydrogenase-like predicted oxidoreductase
MVRKRPFGTTGLVVGEIGFGAWGIGGRSAGETSYGDTDDTASNRALDAAIACGIDFFDTAAAYGDGHSESLLGALVRRTPAPLTISTKAGIAAFGRAADFSPAALAASLTASTERLGSVSGLLLHNPTPALIDERPEIVAFLSGRVAAGELKFWGFSLKSPDDGIAILRRRHVPVIQVNLNMLDVRAASSGLLAMAAKAGTAVIARTPLCFGFLSGAIDETSTFPPGDHRNAWSAAQKRAWADGARQAQALIGPNEMGTPTQKALRFCLSFPEVSVVIPGPLSQREVIENADASALGPLPAEAVEKILELNRSVDFFVRG